MEEEYKLILLIIVGFALLTLTVKALFLVEKNCVEPNYVGCSVETSFFKIVGFNCLKSMMLFVSLLVLTSIAFLQFVALTSEENQESDKNDK